MIKKLVVIFFAILIPLLAVYAWFAIDYWTDKPRPSRNFAAELNEVIRDLPASDRAWPYYRPALTELNGAWPDQPWFNEWDLRNFKSTAQHWGEIKPWIRSLAEPLAEARRATEFDQLGYPLSDEMPLEDLRMESPDAQPEDVNAPSENPMLIAVLLLPASELQALELFMSLESLAAADEGDSRLVVENTLATLKLAEHLRQVPFAVSDVVRAKILFRAAERLNQILSRWPDLLRDDQIQQLKSALTDVGSLRLDLTGERCSIEDIVQRTYSDDGHGDGHFHFEAGDGFSRSIGFFEMLFAPLLTHRVATRRETIDKLDELMDRCDTAFQKRLWEIRDWPVPKQEVVQLAERRKHIVVATFFPALDNAYVRLELANQHREGALVALALTQYFRRHDRWPERLEQLVPEYLSNVPADVMDGQPLRFTLKEGRPVVYSVGPDRIDDGGDSAFRYIEDFETEWVKSGISRGGDWVLWPQEKFEPSSGDLNVAK